MRSNTSYISRVSPNFNHNGYERGRGSFGVFGLYGDVFDVSNLSSMYETNIGFVGIYYGSSIFSNCCGIFLDAVFSTWLHILLKCKQQHIHANNKTNDKVVWELHTLLLSNKVSRHYILMTTSTYNNLRQDNTIPTWLLPCTCGAQRYHCNARFKPNLLCIIGHPYNHPPPKLTIQFI